MSRTALLFPGQGSQQVGMGLDLVGVYPQARAVYDQADALVGYSLSSLCFHGPQELLDDTVHTQPALFVTCLAVWRALGECGGLDHAETVAGHSLGELTALVAAGAMDLADGLHLVRERGRLMKVAGEKNPGGMAAVLKIDDEEAERACRQASDETRKPVQVANYNTPGQVVISGDRDALARAAEILRERGVRRIVPLSVSIAAHSALMATVVEEYRACVEATPLRTPSVPVVGNISARPLLSVEDIRDELAGQLTWPVRWTGSVQWMVEQGIERFVEVGPKDVLTKLVQRIAPNVEALPVGTRAAVEACGSGFGTDAGPNRPGRGEAA